MGGLVGSREGAAHRENEVVGGVGGVGGDGESTRGGDGRGGWTTVIEPVHDRVQGSLVAKHVHVFGRAMSVADEIFHLGSLKSSEVR